MNADCIIVGGGIGGSVLALALGRAGRHVIILERETTPTPAAVARPEILAGATIDRLTALGVGERIALEATVVLAGLELHDASDRRLFGVTREEMTRAGVRPHSTDPGATRRILVEEALRTGKVTLERGVEVTGLLREAGRVVGVSAHRAGAAVEYRALLTVGDDGTKSRIRTALEIPVHLAEFPFDFFGAVVPRLPGHAPELGQAWMNTRGLTRDEGFFAAIFLPIPGDRTALVFAATPRASEKLRVGRPEAFERAAEMSPLTRERALLPPFPHGFGYFKRPFGHAARYVGDGVALIGDAAHPVTPAGGQGANMSIADAAVVAQVALEAFAAGDCSAQRLARYETIRRPANARSLKFSAQPARAFRLLRAAPWLGSLVAAYIRRADRNAALKARLLRGVGQAFLSPEPVQS